MKKKLKILHLLSQRPDSTGSGIYIQAMLREAQARNHSNHLLAGIQAGKMPVLDCISEESCSYVQFGGRDISYQIVGMSDVMPYRSVRFCDLDGNRLLEYENSFAVKIKNAVNEFKPNVIHSHHLWLLSSLAKRIYPDLPVVASCHGSDIRQFQQCTHLQNIVLSGCSSLDAVMALSEAQKNEIELLYGLPPHRIHVVGAGYNDALFAQPAKPDPDPIQLVYAGKLSNAKGVPWLLRALSKIDSPAWQLHLVGSGSGAEKEDCLRLARNLGRRVQIHGAVNQRELARIMRQAHIFILPSFYEGIPLVVLEALACGCRIVANDLPGTQEILGGTAVAYISLIKTPRLKTLDAPLPEEENAFEERLAAALRSQMAAAVKQPDLDLSALQEKLESFSWTNVFQRVQKIYIESIGNFRTRNGN